MSIKRDVQKVKQILTDYKNTVDFLAAEYIGKVEAVNLKAQQMEGQWTADYIQKYKADNMPAASSYRPSLQAARIDARHKLSSCLGKIEVAITDYFSGNVRPEFASKITAFSTLGLPLSDGEFKMLEQEADTYFEKRLVAMLGASRTAKETKPVFENGQGRYQEEQVSDPYKTEELPDADKILSAFEQFKKSAGRLLETYCGPAAQLNDALDLDQFGQQSHSSLVTVSADAFLRTNETESFLKAVSEISKDEGQKSLSEEERSLIDLLIEPEWAERFERILPSRVIGLAQKNDFVGELLRRDDRYNKYLRGADDE